MPAGVHVEFAIAGTNCTAQQAKEHVENCYVETGEHAVSREQCFGPNLSSAGSPGTSCISLNLSPPLQNSINPDLPV